MATSIGIDVGRASATAVALRKRGGSLALERFVHVSLDELREGGTDLDDPVAVARAIVPRLQARGLTSRGSNLGVSGKDAIIRYAHLPPMPPWRLALVMRYDIADAEEKTGAPLSSDFRVVGAADDGGSLVLVAMAKDERVTQWVSAFGAVGGEPDFASPRPVAVGDAYRFLGEQANDGTTLVLDVGRTATEVAIVREGALIFARSVAQGGQILTDRIAKHFKVEKEDAEAIKLAGEGPGGEDLAPILAPGIEQLGSIVRASVDFARSQLKLPRLTLDRVAVTGGAARTPGLVEGLGKAAGVDAVLFDPLANLDDSPAQDKDRTDAKARGLEAAAACGLALARLLPRATTLDLLPNAAKARRTFRERTVWLYGAAASAILYVVLAGGVALLRRSGEQDRSAQLAKGKAKIDERIAAKEALAVENSNRAKNLGAFAARTRPGFQLSALLVTLARELPPRAAIAELQLVRDKDKEGVFRYELRGQIDNAQKDALEALRTLETQLARDPDVGEVQVKPLGSDGPSIDFNLVVKPKGA